MTRVIMALSSLVLVLALAWTAAAADADWPQWRGLARDGKSPDKGLLQQWPEGGPPLAWKAIGIGKGYSGVSIAGGKVFTMGDREGSEFLIALDLESHKELWAAKVGAPWGDGGPRCTPTVDGDLVYGISPHGDLVCVQAADGKEVWRKAFKTDFGGRMMSSWAYSESPLVDGDKLVCTPGGKDAPMVALNKKTGETIWKGEAHDIGGAGYSSIVVSEAAGVRQYVQMAGRGAFAVAAKDGKFLWGYTRVANGTAVIPTPIVTGDYVFVSSGYGTGAALLKLSAAGDGGVKAEEVYFLNGDTFQNHHGGMILVGDHIYAGHGHNAGRPVAIELKTGKIAWRGDKGPGDGSAAVCLADGNVYFRHQNGVMMLVAANPDKFEVKGTFKLASVTGPSWPHPVIQGGKLLIRDNDTLLAYDLRAK